jgi:hypothetical protein
VTYNMITYVNIINAHKFIIHKHLNDVFKYINQIYISFYLKKFEFINKHECDSEITPEHGSL